ncbi:MAG: hypothetical protein HZA54_01090 [Planctomycetes bacterium]|nr:hypothetical protein [Planctomycetota bacterium]
MICCDARDRLSELCRGLLPPATAAAARAHAEHCPGCYVWAQKLLRHHGLPPLVTSRPAGAEEEAPPLALRSGEGPSRRRRAPAASVPPPEALLPGALRWAGRSCVACLAALLALCGGTWYVDTRGPDAQVLTVLGAGDLVSAAPAALRIVATDRTTGSFLSGVRLELSLAPAAAPGGSARTPAALGHFVTDRFGTCDVSFRVPDLPDGEYSLRIRGASAAGRDDFEHRVRVRREFACLLTTDKPLYQPAQTMNLRVLALRLPQRTPLAGQEACFEVSDPKENIIFRKTVATSEFGIAAAELPLADELLLGAYRVGVRVGGTQAARAVEVQRYVLPTFAVVVRPERAVWAYGATVTGRVEARYPFGRPVAGGAVRLRATGAGSGEIAGATGPDGAFRFELPLPVGRTGTGGDRDDAALRLEAEVTDGAGHVETATAAVTVSGDSLRALLIAAGARPFPGVPNEFFVVAVRPDGTPARAQVDLRFVTAGGGAAESEPPAARAATDAEGVARLVVTPPRDAAGVRAEVAESGGARTVATDACAAFAAPDPTAVDPGPVAPVCPNCNRVHLPDGGFAPAPAPASTRTPPPAFVLLTERGVYRVGETVGIRVFSAGSTGPVYVDLLQRGNRVATRVVEPAEGGGTATFALTRDLVGIVEVQAYTLLTEGTAPRATRFLRVVEEAELQVALAFDRATYQPGEEAVLTCRLADAGGAPVRGAVGLALVDESLFALVGGAPGAPEGPRAADELDEASLAPLRRIGCRLPVGALARLDSSRAEAALALAGARQSVTASRAGLRTTGDRAERAERAEEIAALRRRIADPALRAAYRDDPVFKKAQEIVGTADGESAAGSWREETRGLKEQQLYEWQARWRAPLREWAAIAGWGLALSLLGTVYLWAATVGGGCLTLLVVSGLLVGGSALLLPALASARKQSKMSDLKNQLRQFENNDELRAGDAAGRAPEGRPGGGADAALPRVRERFPELLYWNPQLITDDQGVARLTLPLADSITTWRAAATANALDGRFGSTVAGLRVFQDFFVDLDLPVALTQGDDLSIPVAVHNHLDAPQTVLLTLDPGPGFELLDGATRRVEAGPRQVVEAAFGARARRFGIHALTVAARGSAGLSDAVRRSVEVTPAGDPWSACASGRVRGATGIDIGLPPDTIAGTGEILLRVFPHRFGEVLSGMEGLLRMPSG